MNDKIKAAFIGFGEINTQKEIIEQKCKHAKSYLSKLDIEVISPDIVNDDPKEISIKRAIDKLLTESFDFLINT